MGEIEVDVPGVASSREAELLRQLVSPAGLAMSTVRLTVELQRRAAALGHVALAIAESNHRIGRARQIESAAVGAEIRDRVDPHLDSAIELIERASTRDGGATTDSDGMAAVAAVERAREEIGQGLDELRNLARRIYPPRLQDGGLTAALEGWQLGTDTGLDVQVDPRVDQDGPIRADAAIRVLRQDSIAASAGSDRPGRPAAACTSNPVSVPSCQPSSAAVRPPSWSRGGSCGEPGSQFVEPLPISSRARSTAATAGHPVESVVAPPAGGRPLDQLDRRVQVRIDPDPRSPRRRRRTRSGGPGRSGDWIPRSPGPRARGRRRDATRP